MVSLEPADVEERVLVIQELAVADGALEVRTLPECLPVENDHCSEIREVKGGRSSRRIPSEFPSGCLAGQAGGIWGKLQDDALN